MSLSAAKFSKTAAGLWIFLLTAAIPGAAFGAILVPIAGMPASDVYDIFQVGNDAKDLLNGKVAVIPKRLEFVRDPATNRAKFGLQYSFAAGGDPPFVSLTASLRFHSDKSEISAILAQAENKLGLASGSLKVSSLNIFSSRIAFFIREEDGTMTQLSAGTVANLLDGSTAVSLDLSDRKKKQLLQLFKGKEPVGGFIGVTEGNAGIFERKNDSAALALIVAWAEGKHVLSVKELTFPSDPSVKSRFDLRMAIAKALGLPSIVSFENAYVWGWNLDLPDNAAKLAKLVNEEQQSGSVEKIADQYVGDTVLTLNFVCDALKEQIVDVDTGNTGCGGLEP
jgi:hypothetical protein